MRLGKATRIGRPTTQLRQLAARGVLVNVTFNVAFRALGLVKGFFVAAFLTTTEYGVWGVLFIGLGTLLWLRQFGIADKYIQQEGDDEAAFQRAFTLELMATAGFIVLLLMAVPLLALIYGRSELLVPGFVLILAFVAPAFQAPVWIYYRSMDFLRQRLLLAMDPLVSFTITIGLAIAGLGYWSLVIGVVAGAWAAAIAAVLFSPFPLRVRREALAELRDYVSFSWPLILGGFTGVVIAQGTLIVGEAELGLAGAGAITLAATITRFGDEVNEIVTRALYPAICSVRDRTELLFETFIKSNRLALMWAVPFGCGLTLFSPDLVDFVLGERWEPAVPVLQAFGLIAAANHLGFNWGAFYMARSQTRPLAVVKLASMASFLAVTVPLIILYQLDGLVIGFAVMTLVSLTARSIYIAHMFSGFHFARHMLRAFAPSVPAVALVLVARLAENGDRTGGIASAELVLYLLVTVAATAALERPLLREAAGYMRGAVRPGLAASGPS